MPEYTMYKVEDMDRAFRWADQSITKALPAGPVVMKLCRELRTPEQNDKLWPMCRDFEPIEFNGKKWKAENWKCFLLSAFNGEMPAVGLLGEPVSMSLSTSKLSKKRFAELVEFIYATGSDRGVVWSDPALKAYEELR